MFMLKRLLFVILLCWCAGMAAAQGEPGEPGIGDSLYPNFGNGGYDAQHYQLDMTIDPTSNTIDAVTTVEAGATQNLSSFNLDFIGFEIADVQVNGAPAAFSREGQELTITPAEALVEGETFTVSVTYSGVPEQIESVAIPVPTGWVNLEEGNYVISEPDGAANFYPVNDHPLDKATYRLNITVPQPYVVAANGSLVETTEAGDSTTFSFEMMQPMASYLTTINVGRFDVVEYDAAVPMRGYFAPEVSEEEREAFAKQPEMLEYFTEFFGPYPFDTYGSVVVGVETGSALETQTMSIFGLDTLDELTIAHELVHQWFGNSVSLADWRDIWLNEGIATYGEGLWLENTGGREALDEWVNTLYQDFVEGGYPPPGEPSADDLFNYSVYGWAAIMLHALRMEVGDYVFFDILIAWHEKYAYGNATSADFIAIAEATSGQELDAFFDAWLYGDRIPALN
jgi:aminopeptidase N